MSREQAIKDELVADINGHGYAAIITAGGDELNLDHGPTNEALAAELNAADIGRPKAKLTKKEVMDNIVATELLAITPTQAANVWGVIDSDEIDPFGLAEAIFTDAFAGGVTLTNLAGIRNELVSRATELNFGTVKPGWVQMARNLP